MKNRPFFARFGFAMSGLREALVKEQSFRIQLVAAVLVIAVLFALRPTPVWWALFILVIGCVLSLEMINTALEAWIDRVHPEKNDSIRIAKDCAAGAVLIMSGVSIVLFCLFLWERW